MQSNLRGVKPIKNIRLEASPKRVRALKNGVTVVDSKAAQLLYGAFRYAYYVFPLEDIHGEILPDQYEDKPNKWLGSILIHRFEMRCL